MSFSFFKAHSRITHLLIGAGTITGVPTVFYGGYWINEAMIPSYGDELKKRGFVLDIPDANKLDITKTTIADADKWKIDRLDCFEKFFPGAAATLEETNDHGSDTFDQSINISNNGKESKPEGCMIAKIDRKSVNDFTFKSEITIKNDHFGWAIWTHNRRNGQPQLTEKNEFSRLTYDYKLWTYHILFLEKKQEEKWEVKGGYYLADQQYYSWSAWVSIDLPNQGSWIHGEKSQKSRIYSGFWISDAKGTEIFEDIKLRYGGNNNSWLGRSKSKHWNGKLFQINDFYFHGFYKTDSNKWHITKETSTVSTIGEKINVYYEPFKNKKGKWLSFEEYCFPILNKKEKYLSSIEKERLNKFCYTKSKKSS